MKNEYRNPTLPGPLPNLVPGDACYRVYAIRKALFAGEYVDVLGEQIGGDYPTREQAEQAGKDSGLRYAAKHVYGRN